MIDIRQIVGGILLFVKGLQPDANLGTGTDRYTADE